MDQPAPEPLLIDKIVKVTTHVGDAITYINMLIMSIKFLKPKITPIIYKILDKLSNYYKNIVSTSFKKYCIIILIIVLSKCLRHFDIYSVV